MVVLPPAMSHRPLACLNSCSGRKKVEFSPYEVDADTVQKLLTLSKNGESYLLRTNVRPSGVAPA